MGSAGPYQLHAPLLAILSGGAFGQLVAATDSQGNDVVAKLARPSLNLSSTEIWIDTPWGRRPVHVPAVAMQVLDDGRLQPTALAWDLLEEALRSEKEILDRDKGQLLPLSHGLWTHNPTGSQVLMMERLYGSRPTSPIDIRALLKTLVAAVRRGTFDSHGDIKLEHVFIEDSGRVRLCDPGPRFSRPDIRAFTPPYNPRGWHGPAADVAGCATLLRYLPADGIGWRWCSAVLDADVAPD